MTWKGTGLSSDESEAMEVIWPEFEAAIRARGMNEFTVDDFMDWVRTRPQFKVFLIKGDRGKQQAREDNPGRTVINAQNALYHLSASSPLNVVHDRADDTQVLVLEHVSRMTYRLL